MPFGIFLTFLVPKIGIELVPKPGSTDLFSKMELSTSQKGKPLLRYKGLLMEWAILEWAILEWAILHRHHFS